MLQSVTTTGSLEFYQDVSYSISSAPSLLAERASLAEQEVGQDGVSKETRTGGVNEAQTPQWRGGMVQVQVSDLLDTFRVCLENNFQWIEDFRGDAIWITEDLNQVIEAFENMRRETMHD